MCMELQTENYFYVFFSLPVNVDQKLHDWLLANFQIQIKFMHHKLPIPRSCDTGAPSVQPVHLMPIASALHPNYSWPLGKKP